MSDSLSSDYEDESSFSLDLETALIGDCDFFKLRDICKFRPVPKHLRQEVWKICLNINSSTLAKDFRDNFNDVFDLPNQEELHDCCCEFVSSLPKDLFTNSIGFINDIESIFVYYSRKYQVPFSKQNGWLDILRVLCCELKLTNRYDLYNYFTSITHRFLPSYNVLDNQEIFSVFRLLIQYHDPELCSFLDTLKVNPKNYAFHWFSSLFSSDINLEALAKLWDMYFLLADPFLMFYLSLTVLLNLKESLLELKHSGPAEVLQNILSVFNCMTEDDIEDFYLLARHYITTTPKSFSRLFSSILFGNGNKDNEVQQMLDSLCLPVSVHELLENKSGLNSLTTDGHGSSIRYFLIDCRPADQYNAGHLSSAYFLDSSLMMSSPSEEFQTSVSSLLATQQQALESNSESAGEHICFLGSGDLEEDRIVNMVIAQFLQKMTRYVSLVYGGYKAIHDVLGPQCDNYLIGHNSSDRSCSVCIRMLANPSADNTYKMLDHSGFSTNTSLDSDGQGVGKLISKMSGMFKSNSNKMKEKFASYVTYNQGGNKLEYDKGDCKTYRDTGNIFSIDDEEDGFVMDTEKHTVDKYMDKSQQQEDQTVKKNSNTVIEIDISNPDDSVLDKFECHVVFDDGTMVPGYLFLTSNELLVLRKSSAITSTSFLINSAFRRNNRKNSNLMVVHKRRPLHQVIKITSRKKLPECLTFHYQISDGTVEKDRYLVTKAGEAAKTIKVQVQKILDEQGTLS